MEHFGSDEDMAFYPNACIEEDPGDHFERGG